MVKRWFTGCGSCDAEEAYQGEWVRYEDYERLEQQLERVQRACEFYAGKYNGLPPAENVGEVTVAITACDEVSAGIEPARGWGDNGHTLTVSSLGRIAEIMVKRNGASEFGLRIMEDGSVCFTGFRQSYTTYAPGQFTLNPTRPWKNLE